MLLGVAGVRACVVLNAIMPVALGSSINKTKGLSQTASVVQCFVLFLFNLLSKIASQNLATMSLPW